MYTSPVTFLIVCPLVFVAGFIDSIAGGGGIISLPAYLLAGLPVHAALATNKFSSFCGTSVAAGRYTRHQCFRKELVIPTIVAALVGSVLGAQLVLRISDKYLRYLLLIVLPTVAIFLLLRQTFSFRKIKKETCSISTNIKPSDSKFLVTIILSFAIGMYDGFYGPGTGTFLMLALTAVTGLSVQQAAGNTKLINWTSNAAALITFIVSGNVVYPLGIAAAICSILGNYAGAGFVIKKGAVFVQPVIIFVLILLFIKILINS